MNKIVLFVALMGLGAQLIANDSIPNKEAKTGWNFGGVPVVSYNSDLGLQYGALTNIYYYGDGKVYPGYYHSIYAEVSAYTKGSGIYRLFYDSKYFIRNIRTIADLVYLPDEAFDFYGFNGYKTKYNSSFTNDASTNDAYKSRLFYKHKREIYRLKLDFQGKTRVKNLNWALGLNLMNVSVESVDEAKLNKGKDDNEKLPQDSTLYDKYVQWGLISAKEQKGGFFTSLKAGVVYDSRDNEPNPMKGLWSEAVLFQSLNADFNFTKLAITHRHYLTIIPKNLSFAYRLGYQGIIAGKAPFYMLPYMVFSYLPASTSDGLGGSKSVRGLIRHRVVGDGMVFGNLELRYKIVHFKFIKQHFYLALNPFADFGMVVQETDVDMEKVPEGERALYFSDKNEAPHVTYGCGFRIAMNQNFIIAADAGFPLQKEDGPGMGLYIGMNYLF
jgi:hypothetical protein